MERFSKEAYDYRQREMNRLRKLTWQGYKKTMSEIGLSYMGGLNISSKLAKNAKYDILTYCVYLAAADNAFGLEVCNKQTSKSCRNLCLVSSGHAKIDYLAGNHSVQDARNKRTMLYFANRELFCKIMEHEIDVARRKADRKGYIFSIRFNCTSDIPLTSLNKFEGGMNFLEKYSDVIKYDYTKRPMNLKLARDFKNYHVVFSYTKQNEEMAKEWLRMGGSIAVVFGVTREEDMPKTFLGYPVINGDKYDARFLDPKNCVVGLKYKVGKQDFKRVRGKYVFQGIPKSDLIVSV
jgi:hypothetical protein